MLTCSGCISRPFRQMVPLFRARGRWRLVELAGGSEGQSLLSSMLEDRPDSLVWD